MKPELEPDSFFSLASVGVMNLAVTQELKMEGNNKELDNEIKLILTK